MTTTSVVLAADLAVVIVPGEDFEPVVIRTVVDSVAELDLVE